MLRDHNCVLDDVKAGMMSNPVTQCRICYEQDRLEDKPDRLEDEQDRLEDKQDRGHEHRLTV